MPFAPTPELATPDLGALTLLEALAARPGTDVHLVSGRDRATLEAWFGHLPIGLHAEHGLWSRDRKEAGWVRAAAARSPAGRDSGGAGGVRRPGAGLAGRAEKRSAGLALSAGRTRPRRPGNAPAPRDARPAPRRRAGRPPAGQSGPRGPPSGRGQGDYRPPAHGRSAGRERGRRHGGRPHGRGALQRAPARRADHPRGPVREQGPPAGGHDRGGPRSALGARGAEAADRSVPARGPAADSADSAPTKARGSRAERVVPGAHRGPVPRPG